MVSPTRSRSRLPGLAAWVAFALLLPIVPAAAQPPAGGEDLPPLYFPPRDEDVGVRSLPAREKAERAAAATSGVPARSFRFTDRLPESGIGFLHQVVEDAGRHYKAVHYDHGNGLAAGDVDGDGRLDLYFVNQIGANELWRNKGDGTFEDWTARSGLALAHEVSVSASFGDIDNDGDPDLYVTTVNMGNHLFENRGGGEFAEITAAAGLAHKGHSSGAVFFDYNRDGLLDLFVTNVGQYTTGRIGAGGYFVGYEDAFSGHHHPDRFEISRLYENRSGAEGIRFADVTTERGLADTGWSGDAAFADLDRDGWPDLYVLNMQGDDHFYRNVGGERFVDATAEVFPKTPWGAMGIAFFDYDNDGRLDLVLTDMHSDMSQEIGLEHEAHKSDIQWTDEHLQGGANNIFGNALYHQKADGSFEEVSDAMGVETYWPWGLSTGDVDADGFLDLFIADSMNFPWRYQPNALLLNQAGKRFHDRAFVLGVEPRRGGETHAPWFDVDCSGADRTRKVCEGKEGRFMVMGTLGTRSSVIFDLDGDGDLDIVTNEFNSPPQVLVSDLAQNHPVRWIEVDLTGTRSNREGLGAWVTVTAGPLVQTRYFDGKSGYLSQSSMPLYVGLGDRQAADRIDVVWPSGATQTVPGPIASGTRLTVEEPVDVENVEVAEGTGAEEGR